MPFWPRTPSPAAPQPASSWMPLPNWKAPRLACGYSVTSAAFSRLVHSMRCVPPTAQQAALTTFDSKVHECLVQLTGLPLGQTSLQQAARGLSWAGLGLCSTARHAAGAYLGGCLIGDLDPLFSSHLVADLDGALQLYNGASGRVLTKDAALALTQKQLSHQLDSASWDSQFSIASVAGRAILLYAVPHGRTRMEGPHLPCRASPALGCARRCQGHLVPTLRWHSRCSFAPCWYVLGGRRPHSSSPCCPGAGCCLSNLCRTGA